MFESIVNIVVMVLFGVLIGTLMRLLVILSPMEMVSEGSNGIRKQPGESWFSYWKRIGDEKAKQGVRTAAVAPRSYWLVYGALIALIAVLIVAVNVSPIHMNWVVFIPGLVVALMVAEWIYRRSKAGKIQAKGRFWFDPLPEEKPPGGDVHN